MYRIRLDAHAGDDAREGAAEVVHTAMLRQVRLGRMLLALQGKGPFANAYRGRKRVEAYLDSLDSNAANTLRARRADFAGLSQWWSQARDQPFEPALLAERDLKVWVRQRQVEDGAAPATINRALSTRTGRPLRVGISTRTIRHRFAVMTLHVGAKRHRRPCRRPPPRRRPEGAPPRPGHEAPRLR
ncbi:MAG: hypothetical protein HGA45_42680 [Chloroflexales bacterium]|nr:hypothetical protein [Chloroflexales bacterium]